MFRLCSFRLDRILKNVVAYRTGKKCLYKASDSGATVSSYKVLPKGDEDALKNAVATVGPISVAIDASRSTFHFYKKGMYYDPSKFDSHSQWDF